MGGEGTYTRWRQAVIAWRVTPRFTKTFPVTSVKTALPVIMLSECATNVSDSLLPAFTSALAITSTLHLPHSHVFCA